MKYAVYFVVLVTVYGCIPIPHREYSTPEITGTVVDSKTKKKIDGAKIKLYPWREKNSAVIVTTDVNGQFTIEKLKKWRATYPLIGDPIMYGYITISFDRYISVKKEYFLGTGELFTENGPTYQFGQIELESESRPN